MNLSLYIAKRYLFSKKSHQVINIISGVAVSGVALATAALICTLSVFNGFQGVVAGQFTAMDPDIKVVPSTGKSFSYTTAAFDSVRKISSIEAAAFCVEDKAMVQYGGKQAMVTLKGVDDNFMEITTIGNALYGNGEPVLKDSLNSYAIPGAGLIQQLNCGIRFTAPLEVYALNRKGKINLTVPARNFKKDALFSSGLVFAVNQPVYDESHVIVPVDFARRIFRRGADEATSMEIRLKENANIAKAKREIESALGNSFQVLDRYEQQCDIYKVMQVEKLISYIFLSFILLVACFNIIGSLAMLIIEKRDNMNTLRSLGADDRKISDIFVIEGCMISSAGAICGIVLGLLLCLLQQHYGIISMGGDGFSVNSYPVIVEFNDVAMVFATVLLVGLAAVWLPVRLLTAKYL